MRIVTPLMPHQRDALNQIDNKGGSVALFMPTGTGKSLVALSWAASVCPKLVLITSDKTNATYTWPEQLALHATGYECIVRPSDTVLGGLADFGTDPSKLVETGTDTLIVVANYDFIKFREDAYGSVPWDVWIGDESSEFKDPRTARFRALRNVVSNVKHRVILNGTPMTERLEDLFGQYLMLGKPELLGRSITAFRSRFMQPDPTGYGWVPVRSAYYLVRDAVQDVTIWPRDEELRGVRMPELHYYVHRVKMSEEQAEMDRSLREDFSLVLDGGHTIESTSAAAIFVRRIQLTGGTLATHGKVTDGAVPKLDKVLKIVEANRDRKIVIWHTFVAETDLLSDVIPNAWEYTGTHDAAALRGFQDARAGVLLIRTSYAAGINAMADADIVIFYSNPLSYRDRLQAIGRSQRITSEQPVTHVVDLVCDGGADEMVYQMLAQKRNISLTIAGLREMVRQTKGGPIG